jgi:hypothetical protein
MPAHRSRDRRQPGPEAVTPSPLAHASGAGQGTCAESIALRAEQLGVVTEFPQPTSVSAERR